MEVIVSRRGTAFLLRENLNIPVVSLPQSSLDLINSLRKASRISRKIFLPSFHNPITETATLSELLQIELQQGVYHDRASLREIIKEAHQNGPETEWLLGGRATKWVAQEFGLSYVEIVTRPRKLSTQPLKTPNPWPNPIVDKKPWPNSIVALSTPPRTAWWPWMNKDVLRR